MINKTSCIAYWKSLNERDQLSLSIGSIVGIAYLFYLLIYSPLTTAVANSTQQHQDRRETLIWMQKTQQQYRQPTKAVQPINSSKLLSLIAAEFKKPNFKAFTYQLQQTGSGDVQLNFEKVPYNQLMKWLWEITHQYVIHIKEIHVEHAAEPTKPGMVKFNLLITL